MVKILMKNGVVYALWIGIAASAAFLIQLLMHLVVSFFSRSSAVRVWASVIVYLIVFAIALFLRFKSEGYAIESNKSQFPFRHFLLSLLLGSCLYTIINVLFQYCTPSTVMTQSSVQLMIGDMAISYKDLCAKHSGKMFVSILLQSVYGILFAVVGLFRGKAKRLKERETFLKQKHH